MDAFGTIVAVILTVAAATALACLFAAWIDIGIHRHAERLPNRAEMRRYMLCGFYCNPDDHRPVVHRPTGWGYTINLRREQIAVLMVVMLVMALAAAAMLIVLVPQ